MQFATDRVPIPHRFSFIITTIVVFTIVFVHSLFPFFDFSLVLNETEAAATTCVRWPKHSLWVIEQVCVCVALRSGALAHNCDSLIVNVCVAGLPYTRSLCMVVHGARRSSIDNKSTSHFNPIRFASSILVWKQIVNCAFGFFRCRHSRRRHKIVF